MAVASPRYDIARFGAEAPRFSPRQTDLLWVVGTITPAPGAGPQAHLRADDRAQVGPRVRHLRVVRRLLRQLHDASPGIDKIIPCDVYVPGCPPRPEAVLDGLMLLQDKIARGDRTPGIVKPRDDPVAADSGWCSSARSAIDGTEARTA